MLTSQSPHDPPAAAAAAVVGCALPCALGPALRLASAQALISSLWYCCSPAPDIPAPASSATNSSQQSARDVCHATYSLAVPF